MNLFECNEQHNIQILTAARLDSADALLNVICVPIFTYQVVWGDVLSNLQKERSRQRAIKVKVLQ